MKRILLILRIRLVLSFLLFLAYFPLLAQQLSSSPFSSTQSLGEKCTAPLVEQKQIERMGIFASKEYFEAWISDKIEERKTTANLRSLAEGIRLIPVVVHVIHNGEAIGQGANIPDEQIEAQIRILNEDYRRLNQDAANTLPEFQGVAVDAQIEFVLAKQDPRGLPTSGINRVQGPQREYDQSDSGLLSQSSYWNSEDYLNIWVAPLSGINLGWSSFPVSDLDGLDFPPSAKETDGITIDYQYFGEGGNAVASSVGRTATHEIGHFLGLRHIWGDGGCDVDDFVADTPTQNGSNASCQTTRTTCGTLDMIQNYMDYTPDACMNLFTQGQLDRMDVVLANSPRRISLVNGRATQEPEVFATDLALEEIGSPQDYVCSTTVTPQVNAFNAGTNRLTSAEVAIYLNGTLLEQKTFTFDLAQGDSETFDFEPITVSTAGNEFMVSIVSVNGGADQNSTNNSLTSQPQIQPSLNLPYTFQQSDLNSIWAIQNTDEALTWEPVQLELDGEDEDALLLNFYNYEYTGAMDYLISPQINLAAYPEAQLVFDMAYIQYPQDGLEDGLVIGISTDCGNTFDLITPPYNKSQETLATGNSSSNEFIPTSSSNFRTEVVDLSPYADLGNVRIAFIGVNGFGNNLFIKDIRINPTQEVNYGFAIQEVTSPSPVPGGDQTQEVIQVTNTGQLAINSFLVNRTVNGSQWPSLTMTGLNIPPGEDQLVNLPKSLSNGLNEVRYTLLLPNYDQNPGKTTQITRYFVQDSARIEVPWRQYFDGFAELDPWVSISPESNADSWQIVQKETGENDQLAVLQQLAASNSYWLSSPIMDLSHTRQASIFFDRAASGITADTRMRVLLSQNGGETFDHLVATYEGEGLNTISASTPVNPNTPSDFMKEFINISEYTGDGFEKVKLAFVLENGEETTNPIYLDNIELFLSNNPLPVYPESGASVLYPNPATDIFSLAFNLPQREDIQIQIISTAGQVVHDVTYPGTLNQTYHFSTALFGQGVYIIKIQGNSLSETKRLIIQ